MGWKKPKWVQKAQQAANKVGDVIAAPANAIEKVVHKAGDAIAQTTGLDKAPVTIKPLVEAIKEAPKNIVHGIGDVIASPVDGNALKGIQKILGGVANPVLGAAESAAQTINKSMDVLTGEDTDRTPKTKIQGKNPLEQERVGKQPLRDWGKEPGYATPEDGLTPLINRGSAPQNEEGGLPEEGVRVASAAGQPTPASTKAPTVEQRLRNIQQKIEETFRKGKEEIYDPVKEFIKEGLDSPDAKGFAMKYRPFITRDIMERYREAEATKDTVALKKLNAEMEALRKKAKGG
jgi:hypothetical protein